LTPIWDGLLGVIGENKRRFNLERWGAEMKRLRGVWAHLREAEKPFWTYHLVHGGPSDRTAGRQRRFATLLRRTLAGSRFAFTQKSVRRLARQAEAEDEQLAQCLLDIAASESVLAFADVIFGYLQTLDARQVASAIDDLRQRWPPRLAMVDRDGIASLRNELAAASGSPRIATEWVDLSTDLAEGRWGDAIARLLLINKLVMEGRGGAPWVVEERGTFRVRYRGESSSLPSADELNDIWRYPYFMDSLRLVVQELEAA
jgi:hypothetical protein